MIEVREISKTLEDGFTLDKISFTLEKGGSLVVLGPSGCGKTTLLRLIAGLEIPDSGEIYIDGKQVSGSGWAEEPHRRHLGYVFQSPALWPNMTVAQNILFGLDGVPKADKRKRLEILLVSLGLAGLESRYPDRISKGEARRVSIARSIAPRPDRLLIDEALTNLDAETKSEVMNFLKTELAEAGSSLIYVTHDREEADVIGGTRLYMREGRLVN